MTILLAVDVHYLPNGSLAAGVAFDTWDAAEPMQTYSSTRDTVAEYSPGHFYQRELPCILDLLQKGGVQPDCILIDGYVYLDGVARPGLGKHLFDALEGRVKVIGIAKTSFDGIGPEYQVLRGDSKRPLFVTSVGEDLALARKSIEVMHGKYRIPTLLKLVDQLCRNGT
jgi:deoxyribonuclease V